MTHLCVTGLIPERCNATCSYVTCLGSVMCEMTAYMTCSCVTYDVFICHIWRVHMSYVTCSYVTCPGSVMCEMTSYIEFPKLQIIFHKRATKYRSLLLKMTYQDKGSYITCHVVAGRSTHKRVRWHINESRHTWMSHLTRVTNKWVTWHMIESRHM